jgi:hypothetical protein
MMMQGIATYRRVDRRLENLLWLSALLLLALVIYVPMLSLPFFWDDVPTSQFVAGHTYWQIWTDVYGLAYYRPLTFSLFKPFFDLLPPGSTLLPHLFLLLLHVANGWLVGLLTRRLVSQTSLPGRWQGVAGLLASLLFVSYPFAALPVSHFAALVYPLVTLLSLSAVLAAGHFVKLRQKRWLALAMLLTFLAPFAHEAGIVVGFVVSLLLLPGRKSSGRPRRGLLLLFPCLSASFLLVWLLIPRSAESVAWIGGQGILASATFFLQGPSFPTQLLARPTIDWLVGLGLGAQWTIVGLPWWVPAAVVVAAGLALAVAGLVLRRARLLWILGLSLAWTLLMALPAIVALPFPYITVSQRLLYYTAPAAALLWAVVGVSVAAGTGRPALRAAISLSLALLLLAPAVLYVRREMVLHELALRPLAQIAAMARRFPEERHLVVNAVNWVNYQQPWYALGHEGVSVSADYVDFGQLVRLNSGTDTSLRAVTFAPIKEDLADHHYSTIGEDRPWDEATLAARVGNFQRVWLTTYTDDEISVREVGGVQAGATGDPNPYVAGFENRLFLAAAAAQLQGEQVVATLEWRVLGDLPDVTIFRHVYACDGRLLGQGDGYALGRMLPFGAPAPGTVVHDVRYISLESMPADDCYLLGVGLYRPDGTRLVAQAPDGRPLANGEFLVPVQ